MTSFFFSQSGEGARGADVSLQDFNFVSLSWVSIHIHTVKVVLLENEVLARVGGEEVSLQMYSLFYICFRPEVG